MGVTERALTQVENGLKLHSENQIQVEFPCKECVSSVKRCWELCLYHQRQPVLGSDFHFVYRGICVYV